MKLTDPVSTLLQHKGNDVWSVGPDDSVYSAIEKMSQKGVGALLVMSGEQLAGIMSERDYTRKVILQGKSSREAKVREIMTSQVAVVASDRTVEECMRIMTDRRVRHLPVVDGGRVTGVLSIGDLVKWTISAQRETINHLNAYITGQYPA
jgi:CBS domain-containing protein